MSFILPWMLVVAVVVGLGLAAAYAWLQRERSRKLAGLGPTPTGWAARRRHIPPVLFLLALTLLLAGAARPQATVPVPQASGTVILAFDVSNSMAAKDVAPSRLGAAQDAAIGFVEAQPSTVDIGIVAFDQGALTSQNPSNNRPETVAAIKRLRPAGGTSLGQAILGSLTVITGKSVGLPDPNSDQPPADLGYWRSATIVVISDGEDTGGPDAVTAAELAATAGVHIETIGVGTVDGTTIEVDGYQVATALNEPLLTEVAEAASGHYHRAADADSLKAVYKSIDLRITTKDEFVELTGAVVGFALLLLTAGGLLMINWFGRIL
jgi:Ca-activated chloride channel family protein